MPKKLTCEGIHGKTINFKFVTGEIIEALVLADEEVGITVKPLDAKDVPKELPGDYAWNVPPSDPDFYFVCLNVKREDNPEDFDMWVENLSKEREFFSEEDIDPYYSRATFGMGGPCPFAG